MIIKNESNCISKRKWNLLYQLKLHLEPNQLEPIHYNHFTWFNHECLQLLDNDTYFGSDRPQSMCFSCCVPDPEVLQRASVLLEMLGLDLDQKTCRSRLNAVSYEPHSVASSEQPDRNLCWLFLSSKQLALTDTLGIQVRVWTWHTATKFSFIKDSEDKELKRDRNAGSNGNGSRWINRLREKTHAINGIIAIIRHAIWLSAWLTYS